MSDKLTDEEIKQYHADVERYTKFFNDKKNRKPYHVLETELLWYKTTTDSMLEAFDELEINYNDLKTENERLEKVIDEIYDILDCDGITFDYKSQCKEAFDLITQLKGKS